MTLTEAQQFGCVPIAFNSYQSVYDIIDNTKNGYIIEDGNLKEYSNKLKKLMLSNTLRRNMAIEAIESSKRFQLYRVIEKWETLLKNT